METMEYTQGNTIQMILQVSAFMKADTYYATLGKNTIKP